MSFVKTLATLAVGFAAAKGYDKYREMGGMAGVQKAMRDNPMVQNTTDQMADMMDKMGVPGGGKALKDMMDRFTAGADQATEAGAAGLGSLMTALSGAGAAGAEQAGKMVDALTGSTMASDAMESNAKLMIRAMIQAAKADGEIDDDERARILEHLGEIDDEERAFVEAELAKPADVAALAAETGDQMKAQVYATSLMAVRVDTASEASYLDGLAAALGLTDAQRADIHKAMGLS
ncbi:MAG: DUF533 domain-containing protein [Pseudomonadota bacterium]